MREGEIRFGEFRIDVANEQVFAGDEERPMTPKAYNVLIHLVDHAGTLVTKRELLDAIWPDAIVGDAVLKVAVREVRKQLDDDSRAPRFIQTAHRRGYRFIHTVERDRAPRRRGGAARKGTRGSSPAAGPMEVERGDVAERLAVAWNDAHDGLRRTVFVLGEAGLGKTSTLDAFVSTCVGGAEAPVVLRGACVETVGEVEDLACIFDALSSAIRAPGGDVLSRYLRRHAPSCMLRMPWAIDDDERRELRETVIGITEATLRREVVDLFEAVARHHPLALVLDDLQWADDATVDLLALLSRRPPFGMLVLAAFRPADTEGAVERITRELVFRKEAVEIRLEPLSKSGVADVIAGRVGAPPSPDLVSFAVERTEGHPLFLVNLVDDLIQRDELVNGDDGCRLRDAARVEDHVPDDAEQMIRARFDRLDGPSLAALEAASVAAAMGSAFSALSVGAALEEDADRLEEVFEELWKEGRFIRQSTPLRFADGTVSSSWTFAHGLYPRVLYGGLSTARRIRYHLRIVERGEALFAGRLDEIAHEVAFHVERAGDLGRARTWWHRAARAATFDHRIGDAERLASRALALTSPGSTDLDVELHRSRGLARRAMGDVVGALEDFDAMRSLCSSSRDRSREVEAMLLGASVSFWTDAARARETVDEALRVAEDSGDPIARAHAAGYHGHMKLNLDGFDEVSSLACDEAVRVMRDSGHDEHLAFHLTRSVWLACCRSRHDEAARSAAEACDLDRKLGNTFDYLLATFWWAWADVHAGRWGEACRRIDDGLALAERNAHRSWACLFGVLRAQLAGEVGLWHEADESCREALEAAAGVERGGGQIRYHAGIVRGRAATFAGHAAAALVTLESVAAEIAAAPGTCDQILYLPLLLARCENFAALGRSADVELAAVELVSRSEAMGERGHAAMGRAHLAVARGEPVGAPDADLPLPARAYVSRMARSGGEPSTEELRARSALDASLAGQAELQDAWRARD